MSSEEGGTARRQKSFYFINAKPASKTERSQTQFFVRSHVSRWRWQQIEGHSRESETDKINNGNAQDVNHSRDRANWNSIKVKAALSSASPTVGSQTQDWMTGPTNPSSHDRSGLALTGTNNVLERSVSGPFRSLYSIDYIGSGTLDPFQTYPSSFPPAFINWCNTYCISVMWRGLIPSSFNRTRSAATLSWFRLSYHDSTLFTLHMFRALSHKQLHWLRRGKTGDQFRPQDKQMLEYLELESIKRVNKAIQDPSRALSDAIIMSVACLANNRVDELVWDENITSPFQSPLQSLQWLDIYGSLLPNPVHRAGLAQLIKLRGGLESTELARLSPILSYSAILAASQLLSCPQFPFIPMEGDENRTLQEQLGFRPTDLEHGFMRLCKIGFTAELAEIFQAMKAYTSIVRGYQKGSMAEPDMCNITNQRNLVQCHLLSLPAAGQFDQDFRQSHPVYETCRLAGLIFGVGVIFPLPAQTAPFPTLISLLQAELQESHLELNGCFPDVVGVLIWVLTLGGIAATGLPERTWFVAKLGWITAYSGVHKWRDLKQVLESMLWLDCACDCAGQQLWDEVDSAVSGVKIDMVSKT